MKWLMSMIAVLSVVTLTAQVECLKGDCYNGQGTCLFPSGAKYVGEFREGKIHGQGILYFSNGDKYIGTWVNQYREGEGRMVFAGGDEYLGHFSSNEFAGEGTMTYANGNRYSGQWADSRPNGQGVYVFANGDRYEGHLRHGQFEGQGTMVYADGSRYQGQWQRNRRHGEGTLVARNGEEVAGRWKEDQYQADWGKLAFDGDTTYLRNCNLAFCGSGRGKYHYSDGTRYVGEFFNGQPEGIGTAFYPNGNRYEGSWKNNAPNGRGAMHYASGRIVGAIWEYGKPTLKLYEDQQVSTAPPVALKTDPEVRIWAVVIGAAQYSHMPSLRYTDDDAYQVYAFLKSPEGGALPDSQIRLLIDEDATYQNIFNAMRSAFLQADENDVLLFYFSGHGLRGAFLPVDYDGQNNRLEHEVITELLQSSRARHKLVLADACHSGSLLAMKAPTNLLQDYYEAFESAKAGMALLMSSKGEEYSLEDGGLRSGIFSHFLVNGLKGAADSDSNKIVTVDELYNYVYQNVRRYTGNVQTPTLTGNFDRLMPVAAVR